MTDDAPKNGSLPGKVTEEQKAAMRQALQGQLQRMAMTNVLTPLDFFVAMRHVEGYDPGAAAHIEHQMWTPEGFPTMVIQ